MALERHDVDRLYRSLPVGVDAWQALWLNLPTYDTQPKERRPVDELPGDITDYLSRVEALDRLSHTQRIVFKAVVMGVIREWRNGEWRDVRIRPMTYRECAEYQDLSVKAVGNALGRARAALARMLGDEEEMAA